MAGYTIISDIGLHMVDVLRQGMVPELIRSPDGISLFSPDDDSVLSLALYDIEIINRSLSEKAALPLSLSYMVIVNSRAAADMKAVTEQRIMGRALSVLLKKTAISRDASFLSSGDMAPEISLESLSIDERVKICDHICGTFRTSFFISVSPVFIDSGYGVDAARVLNG